MKNVGTVVAAVVLVAVLGLYLCSFQVRYTEVAIVKTWGKPAEAAIMEPGLYWKWPDPIQSVVRYDKRQRVLEDQTEETRTRDGKNVSLTTYTVWEIKDPSKFLTNFPRSEDDGIAKLRTTVATKKHEVVGQRFFHEFVSTDPNKRKLREIEQDVLRLVAAEVADEYGIEVVGFGVKQLGLPQSVTTAIFESMKTYEQAKAERYIAEGEARAEDIRAAARTVERRIMAAAQQKVAEIENEAERVVGEYYREFEQYPELRIFLDKLRTVREALRRRTQIIIDTSVRPFDVFDPKVREKVIEAAPAGGVTPLAVPAAPPVTPAGSDSEGQGR
ncbi:MAG TPA: SPFH domain-containing protein [Phycisphaerae bacterium]|nr:SPFH domain-containing protein [Phycisphaerae bacterium]HNU44666.1 SPFH domain-containing protein [Phycisphaerae bacterium]